MTLLDYPYLLVSLALMALALLLLLGLSRQRRLLLISGFLALTPALLSGQFIPEYWNPRVLFHWVCSPEDLIFSWSVGVIVLAPTLLLFHRRAHWTISWPTLLRRFALCFAVCVGTHLLLLTLVLERHQVMYAAVAATAVLTVLLVRLRRDVVPIALLGSVVFSAFYLGVVVAFFSVFPSAAQSWTPRAQLPFEVLGVPAFELGWALSWGFAWPLAIWYAADIRLTPGPAGARP